MTRRLVTFTDWSVKKLDRKKGLPIGEPDYYHDPISKLVYDLDDPTIDSADQLDEAITWYIAKVGRAVR